MLLMALHRERNGQDTNNGGHMTHKERREDEGMCCLRYKEASRVHRQWVKKKKRKKTKKKPLWWSGDVIIPSESHKVDSNCFLASGLTGLWRR